MADILGVPSLLVSLGVTVILVGLAAFLTGQALAATWRSYWLILPYGLMLGAVDRFLAWGLFGGDGQSLSGYLVDSAFLILVAVCAYRMTRARQMVTQYPWLYERRGVFGWKSKATG
jgi:hypothetical protein